MQPLIRYAGQGEPLVLSPANGFPPLCYQPFLQPFTAEYQVMLAEHRPLWPGTRPPKGWLSWQCLAQDLCKQIKQGCDQPVTLVGHSLGAVMGLFAATQAPQLFRRLVLIDPVFFPVSQHYLLRVMPKSYKQRQGLIAKTLRRPHQFVDHQHAFRFHRRTRAFKNFSDDALSYYIHHGFAEQGDGQVALRFPKEWEADVYGSLPNVWRALKAVSVEVTGLRAEHSTTLCSASWQKWKRLQPNHTFIDMKGSEHLLPMTEPERTAKAVLAAIQPN